MNSKQATVGWIGVGLIIANMIDGALKGVTQTATVKQGPTSSGSSGGGGLGGLSIPDPLDPFWGLKDLGKLLGISQTRKTSTARKSTTANLYT